MSAEKAAEAIYSAIERCAESAEPTELVKLSQAFANVAHGPQGGALSREESSSSTYTGRTHHTSDAHSTEHPSDAPRRPAGFSSDPDPAKGDRTR